MTIEDIKNTQTVYKNVHESLYRSYQTLEKVKVMLNRKDSVETILEVIEHIELNPNH
jgi:hypothetical protein